MNSYTSTGLIWIAALILFYFCTYISRVSMIKKLGPNRWRRLLRFLSYGGFILILIALYSIYCVVCFHSELLPSGVEAAVATFVFGILVLVVRSITLFYDLVFGRYAKNKES